MAPWATSVSTRMKSVALPPTTSFVGGRGGGGGNFGEGEGESEVREMVAFAWLCGVRRMVPQIPKFLSLRFLWRWVWFVSPQNRLGKFGRASGYHTVYGYLFV